MNETQAMNSVLVSTAFRFVLDTLTSLLREEYQLLSGFEDELEKLQSTLSTIESVLEDAEARQWKEKAIRDWLEKLKDVACHAEDVVDEFNSEVIRRKMEATSCSMSKVCDFLSSRNQLKFRYVMAHKIKKVRGALDSIAEERSKFHLGARVGPSGNLGQRQTHSFVIESEVIGREDDKKKLIEMLITDNCNEVFSVIAIVGMGGMGKTTLAKFMYDDDRVNAHFDLKVWICVSDDFDLARLMKSIIELVTESECRILELDHLQLKMREALAPRRFLLVLDDVWDENQRRWEELKMLLKCGAQGSRVVVTTRSLKVSSIMGSWKLYQLNPLSDDHCWSLFREFAFDKGRHDQGHLEEIGKEIVKKCGGVPLAAQALGSLMRFKRNEVDWKLVLESEIWKLSDDELGIIPALRLSYAHLSMQSKQCFAFCSIFPRGHEIEKESLIQLWMANGFITSNGGVESERNGHEVFDDLMCRSFFSEGKKGTDGQVMNCKMHDLMHDLARSVAGNSCFIVTSDITESIDKRVHHVSIRGSLSSTLLKALQRASSLRTLLLLQNHTTEVHVLNSIFSKLKFLRALDISTTDIKKLPKKLGYLKHLRYLNLSKTSIQTLPKSIGYLQNLQVLKFRSSKLRELPQSLRNLQRLRHLDIRGCASLTHMPIGLGKLTCLQTLTDFVIGKEHGCVLGELKELNLYGELFIWNLENVKRTSSTRQAILADKEHLHTLRLTWKGITTSTANDEIEELLEDLHPHASLRRLHVDNFGGLRFPTWLANSPPPNLVEIKLVSCRSCQYLPSFGSIQTLKDLQVIGMEGLRHINREFYGTGVVKGFPSLQKLSFYNMRNLVEWSGLEGCNLFPCLDTLTIEMCPSLTSIPYLPSIQHLQIFSSNAAILLSLANLTTLSSLLLGKIPRLTSLPEGSIRSFSSLKKLNITDCIELQCLPLDDMQNLKDLQYIDIVGCKDLTSFSLNTDELTSLQCLNLRYCNSLVSLPTRLTNLSSLRSLKILGCRNVTSWSKTAIEGLSLLHEFKIEVCHDRSDLSGWLRHLTTLQTLILHGGHSLRPVSDELFAGNYLRICCCAELVSLMEGLENAILLEDITIDNFLGLVALPESLGDIKSLRFLSIRNCHELASLPRSIQGLSVLQGLWIQGCPQLERRCQRDAGEDWELISRVGTIGIGSANLLRDE
ncbi:putative disease resistance protein RGA3 [Typha latifolia]|uniref:putative disease resistance protein RGA3 n=1 Tax=Typha latifolia TaxID=4733 RepID=UPI003C2C6518